MMLKPLALSGALTMLALASPATAQNVIFPGMMGSADGNGVFHGNYCGVGNNGPGLPPTDALDRACMHHDSCTPTGGLPACACNARFLRETHAVAQSPRQPDDLKVLARMVEAAIPVIPCR